MKRIISMSLTLCILVSMFISFDITASAKTTMKKTTVTVSNSANAINVSWKKVSGAKSYKVYRKVSGAKKYSVVKTTNNKTVKYADKKVTAGKTYYYRVVAINGKNTSTSATKSIVRLLAPTNVKVKNYQNLTDQTQLGYSNIFGDDVEDEIYISGSKITWKKSKGANKYDIYRKTANGKYKKIKTTGNVSSYVDEEGWPGTTYYYKVVAKKNNSTSVASSVVKNIYIDAPYLSSVNFCDGVNLTWDNEAHDGFKLYRSTSGKNGTYSLIAKLGKNTYSYLDKKVDLGKTYYYKIVAYKGNVNSCPITLHTKYEAGATINVGVGATDDTVKKTFEQVFKMLGIDSIDLFKNFIKFTPLDSTVASVSDDLIITGISEGTTKIRIEILDLTGESEECGFVVVNVK